MLNIKKPLCLLLGSLTLLGSSAALSMSPDLRPRFLTADPNARDYWPCFSPDGKTVLFSRTTDQGKTWELFTVPTAGGESRKLCSKPLPVSATRATWSVRKNLIAFTGTADGKSSVWLIRPDATDARQVTSSGLSNQVLYPSWYPDGNRLAVVDFGEGNGGVIKKIDLKLHTATPVTSRAQVLAGMPYVSPDGKWIAFAGQKNDGQVYDQSKNSIWLTDGRGEPQVLSSTQGRTPAWSPDGQWVAFESNQGSPNQLYAAFVINRRTKAAKQVTAFEWDANHPVWSPDGKLLVFSARHSGSAATGIAVIEAPRL